MGRHYNDYSRKVLRNLLLRILVGAAIAAIGILVAYIVKGPAFFAH